MGTAGTVARMRIVHAFAALCLAACSGPPGSHTGDANAVGGDGSHETPDAPPFAGAHLIPATNAALAAKAAAYERQFHMFSAAPFGLSLDAIIPDPGDRALVDGFLAQSATTDFLAFTTAQGQPRSVHDIVAFYDEHGDLGMFAGFAAAGDAFRYAALRDGGEDATAARADLLAAIASFHIAATITGTPGTVARGIRRLDEPGTAPATQPPPATCPQAGDRGDTWRPDGSGQYAGWIYNDNNSKDQMLGYVLALGAFWDAVSGDTTIAASVRDQIRTDALALAQSLMTTVPLGLGGSADLIVRDWHDCPTKHLDLNPRVVPIDGWDPLILAAGSTQQNGWNALAALGVMRTLYHITGDAAVGHYYYDELVGTRDYPTLMTSGIAHVGAMYQSGSPDTNFSNVNMAFVAAYGVLRYESDATLRAKYEHVLQSELWDLPHPHDGKSTQQAFFNLMESAFRTAGNDTPTTAAAAAQLAEWAEPPYWDVAVENCDAGELAAGTCTAIDGTTQITLVAANDNHARTPLPKRLRPPSNFEWRSDPRSVNGGGGLRLNPGGDFLAAYWMGRVLLDAASGAANLSPFARPRP